MANLNKVFGKLETDQLSNGTNINTFVFHTLFDEEFSGDTAEEVVQLLYENSKRGLDDLSYAAWWEYQQTLWGKRYSISVPNINEPNACASLLETMLKVGALEKGPIPQCNAQPLQRGLNVK